MFSVRGLRRHLMTGTVAAAIALTVGIGGSSPAEAQLFSPCLVLGSPMPPPCITFDYKKLADWATTHAQEVQKIAQTAEQIKQTVATAQGIGSQVTQLTNINIAMPQIDTSLSGVTSIAGGDLRSIVTDALNPFKAVKTDLIKTIGGEVSTKLFSGSGAGIDANAAIRQQRAAMAAEANVDAYASRLESNNQMQMMLKGAEDLQKEVSESTTLRGDWAANSHIKTQVIAARTQQAYLLSAFLKQRSADRVEHMPIDLPNLTAIGIPASYTPVTVAADSSWDQERQLEALYASAQSILGSLGVVQMSNSARDTIQGVIDDYNAAVVRKAQALVNLQNGAANWTHETGHGNSAIVVSIIDQALAAQNAQLAALRAQPIESLGGAFADRGLDVNALLNAEADPRQFIGNWGDPLKYQNVINMINSMMSNHGSLDYYIDGDHGTDDEVRAAAYAYNDANLEGAWELPSKDEAVQELADVQAQIDAENAKQGHTVNEDDAKSQLQQIVAQANALAGTISSGGNDGAKAAAADVMTRFQSLLSGGTSLPSVEVATIDTSGGSTSGGTTGGDTTTDPIDRGDRTLPQQ